MRIELREHFGRDQEDSCPYGDNFAAEMKGIASLLHAAVQQMKAAAATGGLAAYCLAPSRIVELIRGDAQQSAGAEQAAKQSEAESTEATLPARKTSKAKDLQALRDQVAAIQKQLASLEGTLEGA